jgi:hypothetical protein
LEFAKTKRILVGKCLLNPQERIISRGGTPSCFIKKKPQELLKIKLPSTPNSSLFGVFISTTVTCCPEICYDSVEDGDKHERDGT